MKNNKILVIIVTAVVAVAIVGLGGYYYYATTREPAETIQEQPVVEGTKVAPQVMTQGTKSQATTEANTTESPVPEGETAPVGLPPAPVVQ